MKNMLNKKVKVFDELSSIYNKNNYRLYMIGSSSRDYLLNREIKDFDFVSDATPNEAIKFLNKDKLDISFIKFGVIKYKYDDDIKIDIVTLRRETGYIDFRHPCNIEFTKEINIDYLRRDFTINAIYIDEKYNVIDPTNKGIEDLNNKVLRVIGDPSIRFKEDPLRILRGYRFQKEYDLIIERNTLIGMINNQNLIKNLNEYKVEEEKKKYMKIS